MENEKVQLKKSIDSSKSNLASYESEKKKLEEKYSVLEDFERKNNSSIARFNSSIRGRKEKLNGVNDLLNTVKSAMKYKNKMNSMLTGKEYRNVVSSIEQMNSVISSEKRKILKQISDLEKRITATKNNIYTMQNKYNNMPDEEGK